MPIREHVELTAEEQVSREFQKAGGSVDGFGKTLKKFAVGAGIGIAIKKAGDLGAAVVGMAVDAEEAESAFNTTFGQALPSASKFVDEFANKAGFATYELQQMLAVTGNVVQGIGATEAESAKLSERMAVLAGDVASFSNAQGGAEAVLLALQSAINGEREALKTYGLALSEAEVQEQALMETGKAHADELTRLEKAEATVTLAYEKAGKAIGDLDRTQDSSANTLRRMQARLKEAGTEAGKNLLPALESLLPVIEDMIPMVAEAGAGLAGLFASVGPGVATALSHLDTFAFGLESAFNLGGAGIGRARKGIEELFSFGFADTSNLDAGIKAADRAQAVAQAVRDFRDEAIPGANTATQLANAMVFVAQQGDLSAGALARLTAASGANADEQRAALTTMLEFANENNWRTENIDALRMALAELNMETPPVAFELNDAELAARDFFNTAAEGPPVMADLTEEMPEAAEAILDLIPAAEEAAAAFRDELLDSAESFITGFEELPERVDTTMDEFETNLTDRIEAQTTFWEGLATLAESGFGHLAEEIREQGPSAAGLLEELVGDMERAAELDQMISAAGDQMSDVTGEYATALEENSDPTLSALGQFGVDMIDAIAAGIENGDLSGPLLRHIEAEVAKVTGNTSLGKSTPSIGGRTKGSSAVPVFDAGTWGVPGGPDSELNAVLHGTEIVIPPEGTGGRVEFARQLAAELSGVLKNGGGGGDRPNVYVTVTVPRGATISEAIAEGVAQGAIEAVLN